MLKHIGKHNGKKVVILFRTVPNEDHMCLVAYSDLLPRTVHDSLMQVLESPMGQQAKNFADALFRSMLPDGRNALEGLHRDGFIKKIQTSQVLVTPTTTSSVRLDELNNILSEMEKGEEAIKRLTELDKNQGMTTKKSPKEVGAPNTTVEPPVSVNPAEALDILAPKSATPLAGEAMRKNLRNQALQKRADAKALIAEAQKLEAQARELKQDGQKAQA